MERCRTKPAKARPDDSKLAGGRSASKRRAIAGRRLQSRAPVCYEFSVPRRQSSLRRFGVFGASLALVVACHAAPDVVATKMADGGTSSGLVSTKKKQACEIGRYEGHMNTVPDGGVAAVPFSADINFSLVQDRAGEFQVQAPSSALSGNNANGIHFTAEIMGGDGCSEGSFNTKLVDGKYWTTSDSTAFVPFDGTIAGSYTAEFHGFNGTWSTTLHITPTFDVPVSGTWSANYAGPVMTAPN